MPQLSYLVRPITTAECRPWLEEKHYLRRMTSISYAFGLFDGARLIGVCTFGNAVPMQMKKSLCGEAWQEKVYELNRLCLQDGLPKNAASYFVARCLIALPHPTIVVSYADKSVGHNGYIYQACNFMFTGTSHVQKDWKLRGKEHLHSRTLMDEFAFEEDRVAKLKAKYGDDLYQVERPPKYRYVYFVGDRRQVKEMHKAKRFTALPYPKGDNTRYDAGGDVATQLVMF
jgi:hypothetical protein